MKPAVPKYVCSRAPFLPILTEESQEICPTNLFSSEVNGFNYPLKQYNHAGSCEDCMRLYKYASILEQFSSWYFLARQRKHTESLILKVAQDGERLQTALKETFPYRAGITV